MPADPVRSPFTMGDRVVSGHAAGSSRRPPTPSLAGSETGTPLEPPIMLRASVVIRITSLLVGPVCHRGPLPRSRPNIPAPTQSGHWSQSQRVLAIPVRRPERGPWRRLGEARGPGVRPHDRRPLPVGERAVRHPRRRPKMAGIVERSACPPSFPKDQRVWLHFGAVDNADVWVNGPAEGRRARWRLHALCIRRHRRDYSRRREHPGRPGRRPDRSPASR